MKSKLIYKTVTILTGLFTTNAFAHTGFHNDIYHPLSGVDHFLVVLAIGLVSGVAFYYYKK